MEGRVGSGTRGFREKGGKGGQEQRRMGSKGEREKGRQREAEEGGTKYIFPFVLGLYCNVIM